MREMMAAVTLSILGAGGLKRIQRIVCCRVTDGMEVHLKTKFIQMLTKN